MAAVRLIRGARYRVLFLCSYLLTSLHTAYWEVMPAKPTWPPRSVPRLFVSGEIYQQLVLTLDKQQAHYLSNVMRVSHGDTIILCDNISGEWTGKVTSVAKRRVTIMIGEKLRNREEPPDLWICPALLKKDRFDLLLEKVTELGVAEIHPVITRRCVARKLNIERASSIVTEAAEQCRRTALPYINHPRSLTTLIERWPQGRTIFFADEQGGEPAIDAFLTSRGPSALLIGPEGGFDNSERELIIANCNTKRISLGPRIVRGETAAIAAIALWMSTSGDWKN